MFEDKDLHYRGSIKTNINMQTQIFTFPHGFNIFLHICIVEINTRSILYVNSAWLFESSVRVTLYEKLKVDSKEFIPENQSSEREEKWIACVEFGAFLHISLFLYFTYPSFNRFFTNRKKESIQGFEVKRKKQHQQPDE